MRMLLLLSALLVFPLACGDSDGTSGGGVSEILPTGFDQVSSARISHDGTRIAMVVEKADEYALITTSMTGEDIEELTVEGLGYLSTLSWAPDDSTIYFSGDGIARVPAAGGATEKVVDAFAVASFDVSPDGKMVAWATNGGSGTSIASLATLPVVTADATQIAKASEPQFSPDSKSILAINGDQYTTMDIDGANPITHVGGVSYLSNGTWINNDSFLYLGDDKISKFDIASKKTTLVNDDAFAATSLDYNEAAGKYIFRVNGQTFLFLSGL